MAPSTLLWHPMGLIFNTICPLIKTNQYVRFEVDTLYLKEFLRKPFWVCAPNTPHMVPPGAHLQYHPSFTRGNWHAKFEVDISKHS